MLEEVHALLSDFIMLFVWQVFVVNHIIKSFASTFNMKRKRLQLWLSVIYGTIGYKKSLRQAFIVIHNITFQDGLLILLILIGAKGMSFSSYAGYLESLDDFYIMDR